MQYTADSFNEYLHSVNRFALKRPFPKDALVWDGVRFEIDLKNVQYEKHRATLSNLEQEISEMQSIVALRAEPCFIKAVDLIARAEKADITSMDYWLVNHLARQKAADPLNEKSQNRSNRRLIHAMSPFNTWEGRVVKYLHEYLNRELIVKQDDLSRAIKKIDSFYDALENLHEVSQEAKLSISPHIISARIDRHLKSVKRRLEQRVKVRNQSNDGEKRFVLKMLIYHRRVFGEPRVAAIAELVNLPMFDRPIDLRTIARVNSGLIARSSPNV